MKEFSDALLKEMIPFFIGAIFITIVAGVIIVLVRKASKKVDKKLRQTVASIKTDGGVCPECGGKLIMREGKYGTFIGCSNFPKCRYTQK